MKMTQWQYSRLGLTEMWVSGLSSVTVDNAAPNALFVRISGRLVETPSNCITPEEARQYVHDVLFNGSGCCPINEVTE